jgi:hypothetical protein
VCEFGHNYIRFINDGAQIVGTAKNITGITNADPAVVTSVAHGYSDNDDVFIESVGGMTELNGRTFRVDVLTTDTFSLLDLDGTNIDSTGYGTYTSGGTAKKIYEISNTVIADLPFNAEEITDVILTHLHFDCLVSYLLLLA